MGHPVGGPPPETAYLLSMPYKLATTPLCVSFYTQILGKTATLSLSMVKYGTAAVNGMTVPLTGLSNGQRVTKIQGPVQTWTKYSFTIDPKLFTSMADFKLKIIGSISTQGDFIAVDDVVLTTGVCPTTPVTNLFFCKGTNTQYTASQRCDFIYDCPQKDDEANCGNCDFETGNYCFMYILGRILHHGDFL